MTEPESHELHPESSSVSTPVGELPDESAEHAEPAPEPWTAERVAEWNSYYDIYVVLGVLLLAFVASANKLSHSSIWTQLKLGEIIAANARPVTTDLFSYTEANRSWVNIPWLFEWGYSVLYKAAAGLVPVDPADPTASAPRGEQLGMGALVALTALIRVLTVLVILKIRRPGPGLWWSAVCAVIALGSIYSPLGVLLGGVGGPAKVDPETWGQLFLAIELLLLHRSMNLGLGNWLWGLIPLFLLWANVDESFLIGLFVLAATVVGLFFTKREGSEGVSPVRAVGVLVASALVCLANPSLFRIFPAALEPILQLFRPEAGTLTVDQLSYFGKGLRETEQGQTRALWTYLVFYYFLAVGLGIGSFLINRRRFSLARFLPFVLVAVLWGALLRYNTMYALVLAAVLALNGQEWYHDTFGTKGKLGRGWAVWSTGGRFVTILLVFAFVAQCLTGYGRTVGESRFGFGFDPSDFEFEAAEYLRGAKIEGNVLNTSVRQGDSLVWKGYPIRKVYVDGRHHLFPPEIQKDLQEVRLALREDAIDQWKPVLDRYEISAVMIDEPNAPKTYQRLMQSLNWIPFYDDGNVVMFGRADAGANDLAYFKANRLDSESLAYHKNKPLPAADRPPTAINKLDTIFQNRFLDGSQPHTEAARRWLAGPNFDPSAPILPSPARCIMAIREARIALSKKPDDTRAYRILSAAYRDLMMQESALLAGLTLTPKDQARIRQVSPRTDVLMNRFRQRVTALNFAIQTTPPAKTKDSRVELFQQNFELYQLYLSVNFIDLARDRLQVILSLIKPGDLTDELRTHLSEESTRLQEQIKRVEEGMSDMVAEQQGGPLQRAEFALRQGAPGLAIQELDEALQINVSPAIVTPRLLDLYCDTGQPEKALDLLTKSSNVDDPTFGTEPGTSPLRQGRVWFLLGNYEYAATLWKRNAISALRFERSAKSLSAARTLLYGEAKAATNAFESLPSKITTQGLWEFELGICRLEGGEPDLAAEAFTDALTLAPALPTRLIAAYYLEKLGKPVPPIPDEPAGEDAKPASTDANDKPEAAAAKPEASTAAPKPEEGAKPAPAEAKDKPEAPKPEAPKAEAPKPEASAPAPKPEEAAKPAPSEAKDKPEAAKPEPAAPAPKAEEAAKPAASETPKPESSTPAPKAESGGDSKDKPQF